MNFSFFVPGNFRVVRVDDKTSKELAEKLKDRPANANPHDVKKLKLLATSATFAGLPASGEWITWEPEQKK